MNWKEYQEEAKRTMDQSLTTKERLTLAGLGLGGETGEVVDILKKSLFHGKEPDYEHLIEEIGDVMWYYALLLDTVDVDLADILAYNVYKLSGRYPNGFEKRS